MGICGSSAKKLKLELLKQLEEKLDTAHNALTFQIKELHQELGIKVMSSIKTLSDKRSEDSL